jgi:hypothetical protein
MSHLRKLGNWDVAGYDEARNLQILPIGQRTTFYLIAGAGLDVDVDDADYVSLAVGESDDKSAHKNAELSAWEKEQFIRKIVLTGKSAGDTKLHAKLNGGDWVEPMTISVLSDQNWRQVGKATGEATPGMRQEIQQLPLRAAVLRAAEDQLHSAVCSRSDGFGVYHSNTSYDWCGAFAHWCWAQASAIKNVANPFGGNSDVLLSPQKAINWAMRDDTAGQLLRYRGINPMTGTGLQEYRDIGWNGYQLEPADIVLLREGTAAGWKHVCMVYRTGNPDIQTIDGNQGKFQSIKVVNRSLDDTLPDGSPKLVLVHVTL